MPFTLAHPAAVLPLRRTRLPFDALVVGSMSPDFEYLLRLAPTSVVSHTGLGLLSFCIPAGLVVLVLARALWLPALRALWGLVPVRRDPPSVTSALRLALPTIAAVLLGALTHLAWDAFTHAHAPMVERLPLLSATVLETRWGALRVYKLLQHGSTLAGLALLAWVLRREPWWAHARAAAPWRVLAGVALLAAVLATGAGLARA